MNLFPLFFQESVCCSGALARVTAQHVPDSRQTDPLYIQSASNLSPLFNALFDQSCGEIDNVQPIGNPWAGAFPE